MIERISKSNLSYIGTGNRINYRSSGSATDTAMASVVSETIFGSSESFTDHEYSARGYIPLSIPVPNKFVGAGDKLSAILGSHCAKVREILEGLYYLDLISGTPELVEHKLSKGVKYSDKTKVGGDAMIYYIDSFSATDAIDTFLLGMINSIEKKFYRSDTIKFAPTEDGIVNSGYRLDHLLAGRYYNSSSFLTSEESAIVLKTLQDKIFIDLNTMSSRLTLLLSVERAGNAVLMNYLQEYISVLPIGFRPSIGGLDPLTKYYNYVVVANMELHSAKLIGVSSVLQQYRTLLKKISDLLYTAPPNAPKGYKPIAELLKRKKGLLRDKLHGVRIDLSARAVIAGNPELPIDTIGVPRQMALEVLEYDLIKKYALTSDTPLAILEPANKLLANSYMEIIMKTKKFVLGRQPTLYRLGVQAFKGVLVEGNAIELSPLVTPAYNADFDGDKMYLQVAADEDVDVEKMFNINNIFYSRDGSCHLAPRQEILYGLYIAYNVEVTGKIRHSSPNSTDVVKSILSGEFDISDSYLGRSMGYHAIKACIPKQYRKFVIGSIPLTEVGTDGELTEKWLSELLGHVGSTNKSQFKKILAAFVSIGFYVAQTHPPHVSLNVDINVRGIIKKFEQQMYDDELWLKRGFITQSTYDSQYGNAYNELMDEVKKVVMRDLPTTNGYYLMVVSGARGSLSNLLQMFGMKGRIQRSGGGKSFNIAIPTATSKQLNNFEHFITAWGGRAGLIAKSIDTYAPGYFASLLRHTCVLTTIVSNDCGTSNGLLLTLDSISEILPGTRLLDDAAKYNTIKSYVSEILIGRYIVGRDSIINTANEANTAFNKYVASLTNDAIVAHDGLKLRSPITCENPVCTKCYGIDLGHRKEVAIDTAIGSIAAQSVSEPGTQLTMRSFQKGGVSGSTGLSSAFSIVEAYLKMYDFRDTQDKTFKPYDLLAPEDCYVETRNVGNRRKVLKFKSVDGKSVSLTKVVIDDSIDVDRNRLYKKGEAIYNVYDMYSPREVLDIRGTTDLQRYLTLKVYNLFKDEVQVDMKHFEVIIASMTFFICTKGNGTFLDGCAYTVQEYYKGDRSGALFNKTVKGIKDVAAFRTDALSSIIMENPSRGLSRSILLNDGKDSLTNPIARLTMGIKL